MTAIEQSTAKMNTTHSHRSTKPGTDEMFFHLRNVDVEYPNGRFVEDVTAFIRRDKDGQSYVSFAERDIRDQFCRSRGRTVSRRKWFQNKRVKLDDRGRNYETVLAKYYEAVGADKAAA